MSERSITKAIAAALRAMIRRPAWAARNRRPATATWTAMSGWWRGSVQLCGPGVDDLVHTVATALADASHADDMLHPQWDAYTTARRNRRNAEQHGVEDVGMTELEDAEAAAWEALQAELPAGVHVPGAEINRVASLIGEATGRVRQVAA